MKKLSLVLAIVLVLALALVACGDETEASSAPEAESSAAATESSAAVEESSEESADESSAPTEESTPVEESTPAEESAPVESADGNVALNKTYTISGNGKPGGQYTASLTDGQAGEDTSAYDATWFAFYAHPTADPANLNTVESKGYVIIDLGEAKNLSKIRIHCGNNMPSGVPSPAWIDCGISDSDSVDSFTYMAEVPTRDSQESENAVGAYWTEADLTGFTGRYVKVNFTVNGTWCWINEIEIYEAEA